MYGDVQAIAEGPMKAMEAYPDYFVGIGAFMEGINQNSVVYDLLFVCDWYAYETYYTYYTYYYYY